jgi:hypothetical protein
MSSTTKGFAVLVFVVIAFSRCANLKEVNSFAVTSQQIMDKNKTVNWGYYAYFHDSAYIYHSMPDHLRDVDCHCDGEKKADTIITNECSLLSVYFGVLAKFTDSKSAIDVNPLGQAVQAGTYGHMTVSSQESGIVSGLATGLSDLFTTGYKSKKLKIFITSYHDSVAPLISLLKIRANSLAARIVNLELEIDHVADSLISSTDRKDVKWPILFVYERKMKELAETVIVYRHREEDFEKVLAGGQLIFENSQHLNSRDFKQKLKILVSDLTLNANIK